MLGLSLLTFTFPLRKSHYVSEKDTRQVGQCAAASLLSVMGDFPWCNQIEVWKCSLHLT